MSEESKKKIFISMIAIIVAIVVFLLIFIFAKAQTPQPTNTTNTVTNQVKIEEMQLKSSTSGAFAMPISYVGSSDKGTTITGTIERGNIKVDDEIQIVGMGKEVINAKVTVISKNVANSNDNKANTTSNTTSANIVSNTVSNTTENTTTNTTSNTKIDNNIKQATKGDEVVLTIVTKNGEEVQKENLSRGQVACEPYTFNQYNTFTAKVKIDKNNSSKTSDILQLNEQNLQIYIRIVDVNGKVKVTKADALDEGTISVKLESYVAIEKGTQISIRKDSKTLATGTIETVSNT